ncbi:MAG: NAD-dependent epimerase/dehydratase family protein [Solirubrobacterales bacterium]|nr:NAD-dependent epimerase/dehydratase family protein [Solirubrobacterales bacterium]
MATTLVTGGTGFIGSHLVRALARRGDELRLLLRERSDASPLEGIEFERVAGDIVDRDSVARAMKGVDRVFHVAGRTSLRRSARERVFEVNVEGTRNVLEAALRAGAERAVFTSSTAAIGPAQPGETADENQPYSGGPLGIPYVDSKHEGELVATRVAARGLPVVIVNPSFVLGPDDPTGTSNQLVTRLLRRRIPAYVDGALNVVDVRDVAQGHLLADERGHEGERYILAGRNFTLGRLFADLARIGGVPPPPLRLPGAPAAAVVEALENAGLPMPTSADEVLSGTQWWTYRADKAKRELGFQPRPHEETLEDTVRWQLDRLGDRAGGHEISDAVLRLTGSAARLPSRILSLGGRG